MSSMPTQGSASCPLILVDGSSYFFRAFHALPPLTNTKGQPTGAIYGVVNMIKRLIKTYSPQQLIIIFDAPGKTFRDEWYPEYKAHRPPTPPDLSSQFEPLVCVLQAMGFPVLSIEGVEADDVIGTLASTALKRSLPVLISTSDKDMAQLVNEHVTLINTMTDQYYDVAGVYGKFGVQPRQMIDYLTLVGDTSDNIPGVPKCGPKTAVKWLTEYESLDNLITHASEVKGKVGESLRQSIPQLELSKKLVTIRTDLELPFALEELHIQPMNYHALTELAKTLEFKTWLKEWSSNDLSISNIPSTSTESIHDIETLVSILKTWNDKVPPPFCFYFSTIEQETILFFCADQTKIWRVSVNEQTISHFKSIFENSNITKLGFQLKKTHHLLHPYQIKLNFPFEDVMLEAYVINSTIKNTELEALFKTYLSEENVSAEHVPHCLIQLHEVLQTKLDTTGKYILTHIEYPLLTILAEMELHGVCLDLEQLKTQGIRLTKNIQTLEQEAYQLAEHPFNLNSPKQLLQVLYEEQHLPVLAKTPTGQPSTSEPVLQELSYMYRLPAVILEYRSLTKLMSTYIEALPKKVHPETQRVHTSYNQSITTTGRLSSTDPNLQNIPIRHAEGRLIRKAFVAPPQHMILSADYSQIELRIMAHLSGDEGLQQAFLKDLDIHTATASEIFHTPLHDVTPEQRRRAKAVNFGLIYGMSSFGLSKQLEIDRTTAQQYINLYFERYPGVLKFMQVSREKARLQGFVETLIGRKLYIPDILSHNKIKQKAAERIAINAPLQGTAADIIKKAMIDVNTCLQTQTGIQMIMQVHDELVFEVHETKIDMAQKMVSSCMEKAVSLSIPIKVSVGIGKNWDEAH
jgi:DNA polymerase I